MDADGSGWVPPRPGRGVARRDDPGGSVGFSPSAPRSVSLPVRSPRRRSFARRLIVLYAAGAAVIALVVGAGAALQPVYGSEAPYGGVTFADVRSAPVASGWSLSLAKVFAPGVPADCLTYQAGGIGADRELLTADLPSETPMGSNDHCTVVSPATEGRLVMLAPSTGRIVWTRSLATDLDTEVFSLVWHASRSAGVVVVGIDGTRGDFLLTLDERTGRTLSSTRVSTPDAVINFAVSGHLVVSVVPGSGGTVDAYSLRRTDDLATVLWAQAISSVLLPQLLPDRFIVPLPSGTVAVDGRTGAQSAWGADLRQLTAVRVTGDGILAQTIPRGVGLAASVVLLDRNGHARWTRPSPSITGLTVSRGCVVVSTGALEVSCLDPATGHDRWSTDDEGVVVGTPSGSTTSDIESIGDIHAGDTTLTVSEVDGATGHLRFETQLPRGTNVVGQGVATGYALGVSTANGASSLTAFDLDSGTVLWTVTKPELDVWAGHLVEITRSGVAQELVAPGTGRGGRSASGHDMLVG